MSGQSEIEELRRIRAQQREEAEAARLAEIEKQKEREKRAAFKAKAASFEQKGPTPDDVKASVQKEASARKFNRLLSKQLSNSDGKNPVSTEINLRNQFNNKNSQGTNIATTTNNNNSNNIGKSDWEYVDQGPAGPSYYWNRVTNETTYDIPYELANQDQNSLPPPPPPPPPRRHLPGMELPQITEPISEELAEVSSPPPPSHVSNDDEEDPSNWELVTTQPGGDYYWNVVTNTCTYEMPACIAKLLKSNEENETIQSVEQSNQPSLKWELRWDESYQANYYYNLESGESTWEKPLDYQS